VDLTLVAVAIVGLAFTNVTIWYAQRSSVDRQLRLLQELIDSQNVSNDFLDQLAEAKSQPEKSSGFGSIFMSLLGDPASNSILSDANPWPIGRDEDDDDDDWDDDDDDDESWEEDSEEPDPFGSDPDWWKKR